MKTLHEYFEDLAREPRLAVFSHPLNDLLIYCTENGGLLITYREPGFGKFARRATPAEMLDAQWSRTDR